MKRSRFSEEQTVKILKAAETGVPVDELLREHGVSRATFYNWRKKWHGLPADRPGAHAGALRARNEPRLVHAVATGTPLCTGQLPKQVPNAKEILK